MTDHLLPEDYYFANLDTKDDSQEKEFLINFFLYIGGLTLAYFLFQPDIARTTNTVSSKIKEKVKSKVPSIIEGLECLNSQKYFIGKNGEVFHKLFHSIDFRPHSQRDFQQKLTKFSKEKIIDTNIFNEKLAKKGIESVKNHVQNSHVSIEFSTPEVDLIEVFHWIVQRFNEMNGTMNGTKKIFTMSIV